MMQEYAKVLTQVAADFGNPESIAECFAKIAQQMTENAEGRDVGIFLKHIAPALASGFADLRRQDFDSPADWLQASCNAYAIVLATMMAAYTRALKPEPDAAKRVACDLASSFSSGFLKMVAANTKAFDFESLLDEAAANAGKLARGSVPRVKPTTH